MLERPEQQPPFGPEEATGMDLDRRLAFLGLTSDDIDRLRALGSVFETHADQFVAVFYQHLFAFDETAKFLREPALVEGLKQSQREHFASMFAADWNSEYLVRRREVGERHAEVGIEPAIFLGAYNQYMQFCFGYFKAGLEPKQHEELERLLSALKAIFLDIGLTLDAYFAQLTHRLRSALDILWKTNLELKQFAQLASHDLKTPLATVANLCDEALDEFGTEMPAGASDLIEAARQRTFRMSRMIDELLSFSTTGEGMESVEDISSKEALAEAVERIEPVLKKRGIEMAIGDHFPPVRGNKIRLREAFYNLLSNAVKFLDKEPGRIAIEAKHEGSDCVFTVSDNGPGIPSHELERIFVPFRRLPMHAHLPGSGLGLYFTKSMIEHAGGRVWAESELGSGSRFHIRLPLAAE